MKRMNVEECRKYWFQGDNTVCSIWRDQVYALPRIEVIRGLESLKKLKSCKTYHEAFNLYEKYKDDEHKPKLIPIIINPFMDYEKIHEIYKSNFTNGEINQADIVKSAEKKNLTVDQYIEEKVKKLKFNLMESPVYRDEVDQLICVRDMQIWTDAWIPIEIAQEIGIPDTGFGMDYYEAEYIYPDLNKFIDSFENHGFSVINESEDLRNLGFFQYPNN